MPSPRRTSPRKRNTRAKSPVKENPREGRSQRERKQNPKYQDAALNPRQTSRPKQRSVSPPSVRKSSPNRKKRAGSSESDRSRRSRSSSPKPSSKTRTYSEQDDVETDESVDEQKNREAAPDIVCIDIDDMETRSRSRSRETPQGPSQSTPRSRTTSARTRPVIKQEPQDDFMTKSAVQKTTPSTEAMQGFSDTPKHLYGLDNTMGISSGDEDVQVDSDTSTCTPQNKIREYFLQRPSVFFQRRCSCWCFTVLLIMFIVIAVISALLKPLPQMEVPIVQVNVGQNKVKQDASWNDKSIRELQEKLEQLSAQVSAGMKVVKEDTRIPYDESIDSQKNLTSYIEGLVKAKMEAALDVYSADKLGIPDYALESAGGQIHGSHHSPIYNTGASRKLFGFSLWYDGVPPRVILQPDNTPGTCWAFEGQEGYVVIRLSQAIVPDMFTLEHIPSSLSTEEDGKISNAPKDFSVWGWMDSEGSDRRCLGKYTYNNQGKPLQTFKSKEHSHQHYRYIELEVASNHGHATHTCIYRFRVHGKPPTPTVAPNTSCGDD